MNSKLVIMKSELKESAKSLKNRTFTSCYARRDHRYMHIAYCLLRGRTYEQIEQKVRDENVLKKHHWSKINEIIEKYSDENTLYVVVDGTLTKNQQFVQGTHAVAGHCLEFSQKQATGTTEESSCLRPTTSTLSWLKSKLAM